MVGSKLFAPDFPFSPRKCRIHYGWVIAAAALLGILAGVPGHSMGVNVFTEKLIEALDLTRTEISMTFFIGTGVSSLLLPRIGLLYDRLGARVLAVASAVLFAIALTYLSFVDAVAATLADWTGLEAHDWWLRMGALSLGFFAIRFCGDGTIAFCSQNMISKWWVRRRGRVLSTVGIFASLALSLAPQVFDAGIEAIGWRETWRLFALLILLGFCSLAWLLFRDSPQESGLEPDANQNVPETVAADPEFSARRAYTKAEATRCYAYWCFAMIFFGHSCFYTGYVFHVVDVAASLGLQKEELIRLFFPAALLAAVTNLCVGWASDTLRLKWVLLFMATHSAIGAFSLGLASGTLLKIGFVIGFGCSIGCFVTLLTTFVPRFFGLQHMGAIAGSARGMILFGGAIGPLLMSVFSDWLGSYREASLGAALGFIAIAIGSFWAENPQRREI